MSKSSSTTDDDVIGGVAGCVGCLTGIALAAAGASVLGPLGGILGFLVGAGVGAVLAWVAVAGLPGAVVGYAVGYLLDQSGCRVGIGWLQDSGLDQCRILAAAVGFVASLVYFARKLPTQATVEGGSGQGSARTATGTTAARQAPAAPKAPGRADTDIVVLLGPPSDRRGAAGAAPAPNASNRTRCPYCLEFVSAGNRLVTCRRCGSVYHPECWTENGGCSVFGCR